MAEASATYELRPMGIGDILDTAFRMYRRNFASFLSIALITYLPYALVVLLLQFALVDEPQLVETTEGTFAVADPDAALVGVISSALLFLFVYPITAGALTSAIGSHFLGQRVSAGAAYAKAAQRLGALLGTQVLVGITVVVGFVLLIVPGIIFSLWYMIVPAVVVLDQLSGPGAMKRARALMTGNLGKGFALNLMVFIMLAMILVIALIGTSALGLPVSVQEFVTNLLSALFLPMQLGTIVLLYYDLRIRKEALDLQVLAGNLAGAPSPA